MIHRDIKPHNILLDALGNAWVTDFGLAKLKQEENESTSQAFAGTLRYTAPAPPGKVGRPRRHLRLGATLYEFLALRPIFDGSDPHQLLSKIEHERPKPLRLIDRQIHPDLAAIIARTLAKDPTDRYATAGELRESFAGSSTAGRSRTARTDLCAVLEVVQAQPFARRCQRSRRSCHNGPGHWFDCRSEGLLR